MNKAIKMIEEELKELGNSNRYWLDRSLDFKLTAVERKKADVNYNKSVTRYVAVETVLNKLKGDKVTW